MLEEGKSVSVARVTSGTTPSTSAGWFWNMHTCGAALSPVLLQISPKLLDSTQKLQTSYFHSSSICRLFYSTNCCKCNMSGKYCKFCITVQADAVRRLLLSEEIKPKKFCLHVRKKSFSKVVTG